VKQRAPIHSETSGSLLKARRRLMAVSGLALVAWIAARSRFRGRRASTPPVFRFEREPARTGSAGRRGAGGPWGACRREPCAALRQTKPQNLVANTSPRFRPRKRRCWRQPPVAGQTCDAGRTTCGSSASACARALRASAAARREPAADARGRQLALPGRLSVHARARASGGPLRRPPFRQYPA